MTVGLAPEITPENVSFWEHARRGELVVDRCTVCGRHHFPPRRWCATCHRADTIDPAFHLHGPASLYSYTVNHVSWLDGMEVPFVLGLAELSDAPGVRIPCRVRTSRPDQLAVGMALRVGFEAGPAGVRIPSFLDDRDAAEGAPR